MANSLEPVKKIIEERGWIKGKFTNPDGVCLAGACSIVAAGVPVLCDANLTEPEKARYFTLIYQLSDRIKLMTGVRWPVALYNDRADTTLKDVIELLSMEDVDE